MSVMLVERVGFNFALLSAACAGVDNDIDDPGKFAAPNDEILLNEPIEVPYGPCICRALLADLQTEAFRGIELCRSSVASVSSSLVPSPLSHSSVRADERN